MGTIIHVEQFTEVLTETDMQKILFSYFEVQTGNASKMKITGLSFPLRVEWQELLANDYRVKMKLSPATKPSGKK